MADEKKVLDEKTLENASGGWGNNYGYYMTVGNCNGGYLALRSQAIGRPEFERDQLWPGDTVFTYGKTCQGTGIDGYPCLYIYVFHQGLEGWVNYNYVY